MATSRPVHDPVVLRAIAHPVRARILTELSATGSMRAADVARELGVPANQASFHLRQLAKYGLVEEDPAAARDRRDRVWRIAAAEPINIDLAQIEKAPGGRAASKVFMQSAAAWAHVVVDAAYTRERDKKAHRSISEDALKLSKAEAEQLQRELTAVVQAWAERTRGADPDRSTYHLFTILQPYPDLP
jgi:predicted ArsR family transcriptional regulator